MCAPAIPILMAVSVGAGIFGTIQQMNAAKAAGAAQQQQYEAQASSQRYQAQVAANNAIIQERNARAAIDAGNVAAQNKLRETAQTQSKTRAAMAANGLDTTSGTSLDILGDEAKLGTLDTLTIRHNADKAAYDYRIGGMSDTAQSDLYTMGAKNSVQAGQIARSTGNTNAMTSLLSGATSLSSKFLNWQQEGLIK
jgi:hypothetical protein